MAFTDELRGNGLPVQLCTLLSTETVANTPSRTVSAGVTATGTTIADAHQIVSQITLVTTAAANTGVKLPSSAPVGSWCIVSNAGANLMYIYPHSSSGTLNSGGAGGALTIATGGAANLCIRTSSTNWELYALARET